MGDAAGKAAGGLKRDGSSTSPLQRPLRGGMICGPGALILSGELYDSPIAVRAVTHVCPSRRPAADPRGERAAVGRGPSLPRPSVETRSEWRGGKSLGTPMSHRREE